MTIQQIYFGQQTSATQPFGNQNGIAMFGGFSPTLPGPYNNVYNIINNTGVFAGRQSSPPSVTIRADGWGVGYGGNLGLYIGGRKNPAPAPAPTQNTTVSNYVSSAGVIASDTPTPTWVYYITNNCNGGTVTFGYTSAFCCSFFSPSGFQNYTATVSPVGTVSAVTPNVNAVIYAGAGVTYGGDKGLFAFGANPTVPTPAVNFQTVSNTGVLSSISPFTNGPRPNTNGLVYGGDKGLYCFGLSLPPGTFNSASAYVTNTGVIGADQPYTNAIRSGGSCGPYGGDKGWYYGGTFPGSPPTLLAVAIQSLVSNTGVLAADSPSNGAQFAACGIGFG
jgi:hypothetical protein